MRIKTTNQLQVEPFPSETKTWIGKLISPINEFFEQTIKIVNDGLVFPDNFVGKEKVFSFTYRSESTTFPLLYLWTLSLKPGALQIVSATEDGEPVAVVAAWKYDGTQVQLTSIVKLTNAPAVALLSAGSKYEIKCRITP